MEDEIKVRWHVIVTSSGALLKCETGHPVLFPTRNEAKRWKRPCDRVRIWKGYVATGNLYGSLILGRSMVTEG